MASVNYYSFFDGWDAGVEADRKQAAEERLAEKNRQSNELYTLALPSQKLASEKAAEALDSYLFTAGLRKKHLENQAALAMGQQEAFAGILPQMLAVQPQGADNYFQTQLNGLNSATLENESTQRQNTMLAANPITLDPAVRDNMARLLAAGVDVDISAFGLSKEEQAAMNVAQKAAFVADPYKYRAAVQAEQQKTLQAELEFLNKQSLAGQKVAGQVALKATPSGGKVDAASAPAVAPPAVGDLTGQSIAGKPAGASTVSPQVQQEINRLITLRMGLVQQNNPANAAEIVRIDTQIAALRSQAPPANPTATTPAGFLSSGAQPVGTLGALYTNLKALDAKQAAADKEKQAAEYRQRVDALLKSGYYNTPAAALPGVGSVLPSRGSRQAF